MERVFGKVRNLDVYPKVNEDFYSRTLSGGVITLVSSLAIALLVISEFSLYLSTVTETKLVVDTSRGEKFRINFNVTFPDVPCTLLSLDATDISGERHMNIKHDILKERIDAYGNVKEVRRDGIGAPEIGRPLQKHGGRLEHNEKYCGTCFGAEMSDDQCCNSCEEVREAYRKKGWGLSDELIDQCKREDFVQKLKEEKGEGCNIHGSLEVNKVAGNFHLAIGKSLQNPGALPQELMAHVQGYNITHSINTLSFGGYIPGIVNPLDGVHWVQEKPNGVYQYFIKVVPTKYTDIRGHNVKSNQFSVTEHYKSPEEDHFQSSAGVYFFYDFSPIQVTFTETHTPFLHFLTHVCAIVGGMFTVAGIVDAFVYHGQRALRKKLELGKLG